MTDTRAGEPTVEARKPQQVTVMTTDFDDNVKVELYSKGGKGPLDPDERIVRTKQEHELMPKSETGYVGLMNQGATCYLNSLLQSLYMTIPFRQAILEWKYDPDVHGTEEFCIPRQLQILFARLAFTCRAAVGTTSITHSFHWSNAESFRQHDIQELMRELFDAIERTLKGHPNEKLISELYEGRLVDYLHCPECKYKREHSEKFLDLSVVIKEHSDLNAALQNYIEPEVLSGDNRWRCSSCNTKVDARKGLSIAEVPEILTLQLKRFVFDLTRNVRVKLHDKFTFEEALDMSQYVSGDRDACALQYELFAILMHGGTAMGGHYYAFIKSDVGTWVEFNDAVVSEAEFERIQTAAFGGEDNGTSAYMLMYKRKSVEASSSTHDNDNSSIKVPDELKAIVETEDAKWREEQAELERERRRLDLHVIYGNRETKFRFDKGETVGVVQSQIAEELGVAKEFPPERFRLRFFAAEIGFAQATLEDKLKLSLEDAGFHRVNTMIVETRSEGEDFPAYNPDEVPIRAKVVLTEQTARGIVEDSVFTLQPKTFSDDPDTYTVRVMKTGSIDDIRAAVADACGIPDLYVIRMDEHRADELQPSATLAEAQITAGCLLLCEPRSLALEATPLEDGVASDVPVTSDSYVVRLFDRTRCQITIEYNDIDMKDPSHPEYTNSVRVNRSSTLAQLKSAISPSIGVPVEEFRLRSSATGPQFKDEAQTLEQCQLRDLSIVHIERGRPLQKGEYNLQFCYYDPSQPRRPFTSLFELPFSSKTKVRDIKAKVLQCINEISSDGRSGNTYGIRYLRLREKTIKKVGKIFQDDDPLCKSIPRIIDGKEVAVQKIDAPETVTSKDRAVFVQRFLPDKRKFGKKVEIVVAQSMRIEAFKQHMAERFSIPCEHVGIAKGTTFGPKMTAAQALKLKFNDPKLEGSKSLRALPRGLYDGDLILVQDMTKVPDEVKAVDKPKVVKKARKKPMRGSGGAPSSHRPEHGLKIYTEMDMALQQAAFAEFERLKKLKDTENAASKEPTN